MRSRIVTFTLAALTALAMMAAPAGAHFNGAVENEPVTENTNRPAGFVGPIETTVGTDNYRTAHNGIECSTESNPNIASLAAVAGFECPSPKR